MPIDRKQKFGSKFRKDTGGNVAMMFGLSILGLTTFVGAAVDYSGMTNAKAKLQAQVDSGVLAAARLQPKKGRLTVKDKDRKELVRTTMAANGYNPIGGKTKINIANPTITVKATTPYHTAFMGLIGMSTVDVSAKAQSQINSGGMVEIALVLDNTASMTVNGKLDALKTGAKGLLGTLQSFPEDKVAISIVPFTKNVNVGVANRGASWLDMPDEYTVTRNESKTTYSGGTPGTCTTAPATGTKDGASYTYDKETCTGGSKGTPTTAMVDRDYKAEWKGCVGARPGGLHIVDGTYSTRVPGLTGFEARERNASGGDRRNYCARPITPLTNNFTVLRGDIDKLYGTDDTYMPLGVAWGQRVLSSAEPFAQGKPAAKDIRKMMILMTDGMNTVHLDNPPYLDSNKSTTSTTLVEQTDKDTLKACKAARDAGIEIVTIAFQVTDAGTKDMLQKCASGKKNYHDAGNNAKLIATFEKIGARLSEVRLTQ